MTPTTCDYADFVKNPNRSAGVIVHRGMWQEAPENSILAIERAIDAGHDVVEIDVRRTLDGQFVLLHDDTLERMTGVNGRPEDMTADELSSLRLRNRDGGVENDLTGEKLPTLQEVFDVTRDRIFLHIDVKHRDVIPGVIAFATQMGVDRQVDFWTELKSEGDHAWITANITPSQVPFIAKTRLNVPNGETQRELVLRMAPLICEVYFDSLDDVAALSVECQKIGTALWYNTLDPVACGHWTDTEALRDPEAIWGKLIDAGISMIQTDYPNELRSFLDRRGRP